MPDDKPGETVHKETIEQVAAPELVNPPAPPDNPPAPPAQPVSENGVESAIHAVEDRVKRAEWLMIGLTAGIVLLTLGLVIVGLLQWSAMRGQLAEMKSGGADTHDLAVAEGNQAEAAGKQADRMKDFADRMKDQADRTKELVGQAKVSADAANSAAQTAAETLDVTQRPWITQSAEIGAPITFSVNGASITFLFTLDNVGHTPAEKVWVEAKLVNIVYSGMPSIKEHQRVCDGPTTATPKNFTLGETLFPLGKPLPWAWSWTIPWNEIQAVRAPNILGPVLYGCIEYSYGLSTKRHSTPFRYAVVQADGRLLVQDGGFNISTQEIPAAMLRLRREGALGQPAPN